MHIPDRPTRKSRNHPTTTTTRKKCQRKVACLRCVYGRAERENGRWLCVYIYKREADDDDDAMTPFSLGV